MPWALLARDVVGDGGFLGDDEFQCHGRCSRALVNFLRAMSLATEGFSAMMSFNAMGVARAMSSAMERCSAMMRLVAIPVLADESIDQWGRDVTVHTC
ncbi:MAG: hypothetical protein WCE38_21540 [Burkholderiales bacterium]